MDCLIRNEKEEDYKIVENLVRESFWNVYKPGCDEHYLVHIIRNDPSFDQSLHFVMEMDNQIIGEALLFPSFVKLDDNKSLPSLTLGPICISKDYQRKGYGKKLLDYCLEKAKEAGHGVIFLEGNISFYGKSGFKVASDFNIRYNDLPIETDTSFFLCKELVKGYLDNKSGSYITPKAYFVDERKAEEFDKSFPKKEKLRLKGQIFG